MADSEMTPIEKDEKTSSSFSAKEFFVNLKEQGKRPMRLKKYVVFILFALIFILTLCLIIVASVGLNNSNTQSAMPTNSQPTLESTTYSSSTTDPNGDGPWQNPLLSDDTIPYSYKIEFSIYPKKSDVIVFETGVSIIAMNNLDNNEYIILHKDKDLSLLDPNVFYLNGSKIALGKVFTSTKYEYFVIQLKDRLQKNEMFQIDLYVEGFVSTNQQSGALEYETS